MQQINLYNAIPKPPREWLPTNQILPILIGVLALFSLVSIIDYLQYWHINHQLTEVKLQQVKVDEDLLQTAKKYPEGLPADKLAIATKNLHLHLQARSFTLERLIASNADGFSKPMLIFIETIPATVWLTQFSIDNLHDNLSLVGSTIKSDTLPDFIQALESQAPYKHSLFRISSLTKDASNNLIINFVINKEARDSQ